MAYEYRWSRSAPGRVAEIGWINRVLSVSGERHVPVHRDRAS